MATRSSSHRAAPPKSTRRRAQSTPPAAAEVVEKVPLRIARMIAREVASERLPPGTMLETEVDMARRFGVGRPSVREALRLLEAQGLIEIRRGVKGGPVVASPTGADLGQTMTMFLQMRSTPLRQVIDAGAELHALIASLAAQRVAEEGASVEPLRAVLARESEHVYDEERLYAGIEFHALLRDLAGNEVLGLLVDAVGGIVADRTRTYRHDQWDPDERKKAVDDHVKMLKAIERGDAKRAAALAREHILSQAERDLEVHPEMADAIVDWR
jgi:DNA-binding FadR family transcriptional regulator